jgi:hypothetical protein
MALCPRHTDVLFVYGVLWTICVVLWFLISRSFSPFQSICQGYGTGAGICWGGHERWGRPAGSHRPSGGSIKICLGTDITCLGCTSSFFVAVSDIAKQIPQNAQGAMRGSCVCVCMVAQRLSTSKRMDSSIRPATVDNLLRFSHMHVQGVVPG